MLYLLWVALGCGVVLVIRLGIDARESYLRREKSEEHLEKLNSTYQ